jgi:hypothetical protein
MSGSPDPTKPVRLSLNIIADATLLQRLLSDERERRLAYLLFHCGLSPREIAQSHPSEFANLQEIYQLRCSLMGHLQSSNGLPD